MPPAPPRLLRLWRRTEFPSLRRPTVAPIAHESDGPSEYQFGHSFRSDSARIERPQEGFLPCDAMRCTVLVIVIPSVRPSVCPSVCYTRGLCPHGSTYDHDFFTIW